MESLTNQIVENVFLEERVRLWAWLRHQKRRPLYVLAGGTILLALLLFANIYTVAPFVILNYQLVLNWLFASWIIALLALPFLWPAGPNKYFAPAFKKGLDPRVWDFEGGWRVDKDENGKQVISVTDSNRGGLVIPCLQWSDYEATFETRMIRGSTGWIVRATSLNDYVLHKLDSTNLVTFNRVTGLLPEVGRVTHGLTLTAGQWIPVRVLARGNWLSVYITAGGSEVLVFQDQALGIRLPFTVETKYPQRGKRKTASKQIVSPSYRIGSFGFRVYGTDLAQFRSIRAYRL